MHAKTRDGVPQHLADKEELEEEVNHRGGSVQRASGTTPTQNTIRWVREEEEEAVLTRESMEAEAVFTRDSVEHPLLIPLVCHVAELWAHVIHSLVTSSRSPRRHLMGPSV